MTTQQIEQARGIAIKARGEAVAASEANKQGSLDRTEAMRLHEAWICACAVARVRDRELAALEGKA